MICRVCDSTRLEPVIDLGSQPWCNHFLTAEQVGKEPFYPLRVVYCLDCATSQLDYTVKKEVMFADHTYLSGTTKTLSDHFKGIAKEVDDLFFKGVSRKAVLDIGSNDGTQLGTTRTSATRCRASSRRPSPPGWRTREGSPPSTPSSTRRPPGASAGNSTRSTPPASSSTWRSSTR